LTGTGARTALAVLIRRRNGKGRSTTEWERLRADHQRRGSAVIKHVGWWLLMALAGLVFLAGAVALGATVAVTGS
jgi:hypothetical protein